MNSDIQLSRESEVVYVSDSNLLKECDRIPQVKHRVSVSKINCKSNVLTEVVKSNLKYNYNWLTCLDCNFFPLLWRLLIIFIINYLLIMWQASVVHELISAYGLLEHMTVVPSRRATEDEVNSFHSKLYIQFLQAVNDSDDLEQHEEDQLEFGFGKSFN